MVAAKGNRQEAAILLAISRTEIDERIKNHKGLSSLWGSDGENDSLEPDVLGRADILDRDLSERQPNAIELANMVGEAEKLMHEKALKRLGVSDTLIQRIRDLDGLASTSGHFIALSLEKTHRSYYLQSMQLMELAHSLHKRLMSDSKDPDGIADDEIRACFNRNYTDMVREAGRTYELMLTGAQAMVEMMLKMRDSDSGRRRPTGKPGWDRADKPANDDA